MAESWVTHSTMLFRGFGVFTGDAELEEADGMDEDAAKGGGTPIRSTKPDPEKVESRAKGRPPEEGSSDDAKKQAEVILEDSEVRMARRAAKSEPRTP